MVGNDLVYFANHTTRKGTRLQHFLEKTFTQEERGAISASRFVFMHHLIWSAKEAAFKVFMQQNPKHPRFYAPKKFEVSLTENSAASATGQVVYGASTYYFQTEIAEDYLHTIAVAKQGQLSKVEWKIEPLGEKEERLLLLKSGEALHFVNDLHGIPRAFDEEGQKVSASVSLSHDGPLQALSALLL